MRIGFTGGGSGGHFYPLIAVAEEIRILLGEKNISDVELFYFGPNKYDEELLTQNNLTFIQVIAGKRRQYFSLLNFLDIFKTIGGIFMATWKVFRIYPDVVFSKGGFTSVPVLFACRILFIPVVIHESDTIPGRANKWAGRFAKRIAISYAEASEYFKGKNIAHTGQPIRKQLTQPLQEGSHAFFGTDSSAPTLLVLGGSQGAELINNVVVDAIPELIEKYNIIHQAGERNLLAVQKASELILQNNPHKNRYKVFGFIDTETTRRASGIADLVISRAGSTIFEIAAWGIPSIIVPITHSSNNHQKRNAFVYAQSKAASVIGENNLTEHILATEVSRILEHEEEKQDMIRAAQTFNLPGASRVIAEEILELALRHEQ